MRSHPATIGHSTTNIMRIITSFEATPQPIHACIVIRSDWADTPSTRHNVGGTVEAFSHSSDGNIEAVHIYAKG